MKVSVLASGSKGNSTYIETSESKLLIDIGTSCLYIERNLKEMGIDPSEIDGILLTHTHVDHIQGLRVFIKKYKTKVYLSEIMYKELMKEMYIANYEIIDIDFSIKDINVKVLKTSHDTDDSNGYILKNATSSLAYITDTGYIHRKYYKDLDNLNLYVMESNHDVEMLMNGRYPYHLKQRILGDRGHLSNADSASYLNKFIGPKTEQIILIHLSEENNTEELALDTLKTSLEENDNNMVNIIISTQTNRTELVEI